MILIFSILLLTVNALGSDIESQKTFFKSLENKLISQYQTCTNDTLTSDIDSIMRWKKRMNHYTETPQYKKILKEFIICTGINKDILPCQVLKWDRDRRQYLKKQEKSLTKTIVRNADNLVDSIQISRELANNLPSKFDFAAIPFGISKDAFFLIFNKRLSYTLEQRKNYLFAEHFFIMGTPFTVKFFFTSNNRYFKYEIDGYTFSPGFLDKSVRPQATLLKDFIKKKVGQPDHIYRIGYFDIKPTAFSRFAVWRRGEMSAIVSIGIEDHRFFTKATVTSESHK